MDSPPNKNKISLLVYENKKSPKYFEVNRNILKLLIVGFPSLTIIAIGLLILGVFSIKQVMLLGKTTTPRIINELRAERAELLRKQAIISSQNNQLKKRYSQHKETPKESTNMYGFFKTPKNADKSQAHSDLFLLEDVQITPSTNKVYLKFNLVNNTPKKTRLEGYLFITLKARNSIHFYPAYSLSSDELEINFNRGESFSTSRFRPVITDFPFDGKPTRLLFHVYTFSKEGSLTFVNSFSYNIKNYQIGTTISLRPTTTQELPTLPTEPTAIPTKPKKRPSAKKIKPKIKPTAIPEIIPTPAPLPTATVPPGESEEL